MADNKVLQEKLRNYGTQTEGASQLMLEAANEIKQLRSRLELETKRRTQLEETLAKLRDDMNATIHKILGA